MLETRNSVVWLGGIVALGLLAYVARTRLSPAARARRRRERSHRPVVSRKQGPTVKLAVNVAKQKRDRKP